MEYHIIGGDGKVYGPKPESEVRDWIREGRLNAESRICRAGGEDWLTLDRLPEFAMDLGPKGATAELMADTGNSRPALDPLPPPQSPPLPGSQSTGPGQSQPIMQVSPGPSYPSQQVMAPQRQTNNGMAITGMILGIISLVLVCCCYGIPFNILGLVFSIIGLSQIKKNPNQQGKGMALAGLICSIISIVAGMAMLALGLASNAF